MDFVLVLLCVVVSGCKMPCFRPLDGWRAATVNENGKRPIVFKKRDGFNDIPVKVPCGQCIGCRLERSRQWAMRCVHEASLFDDNCFVTLTYSDENLPAGGSLCLRDFQLFMKRLRFKYGEGIRFFHCGEYGERFQRPHYHALLFNHDFSDKVLFKRSCDFPLYSSDSLSDLWPFGHCLIGDVTFESAAYVARYITKKITGDEAESHYGGRIPEYITMSRRPGIGSRWFDEFKGDILKGGFVVINGKKVRPPKYYDSLIELDNKDVFVRIKRSRVIAAKKVADNNTSSRHRVREKVTQARVSKLVRGMEV